MKKLDPFEKDILATYDAGEFKSTRQSKADLAKFKAAATATFIKDKQKPSNLSARSTGRTDKQRIG